MNHQIIHSAWSAWPTSLGAMRETHGIFGSVRWCLADDGLRIENGTPETTRGRPTTVARVWRAFGPSLRKWAAHYQVPLELIIATACTETNGNPDTIRREPGYRSDEETPQRISAGLMQTLISTARWSLDDAAIDRAWLLVPENSIRAGTAYIAGQRAKTGYDPPKVACAYNAGGVYEQTGEANRWRMRQYPIGTSHHADRFVRWFNDCFRLFEALEEPPDHSFWRALNSGSKPADQDPGDRHRSDEAADEAP